jgi:amidase
VRHVHAFEDDVLGELDAVGLADAIKAGRLSRAEAVEAAIARTEAVNPVLNGLACQAFDQARAKALERVSDGEFFAGVPTFVKDCVGVAGLPTMSQSVRCRSRMATTAVARSVFRHPAPGWWA